jgi:fluoroquinolone transport system permease protein
MNNALHTLRALGPIDVQNIRRDPLLKWIILIPLAMALMARSFLPTLLQQASALLEFDLLPYYPPLMAFTLLILTPILAGTVIGFLLLDQRDDHTLSALLVTPLTLNGYLAYRLISPSLASLLVSLVILPVSGLAPLSLIELAGVALSAAPLAPLYALFIATFAANKVQGFAISKATGVLMLPPVIAFFIPAAWRIVFGLAPNYWPGMLLWGLMDGSPGVWVYLPVGIVYQGLLLWLLLRRYNHVLKR